MDRTVPDPMTGRVLDGRYRVGPRIARGGMATVYQATDLRLDRLCALKVMHAGLGDDDDFVGRFVREARSAARLSHPNVVGVFDQGDDDGTLFLAMEYIPGHTLRDLIRTAAPMRPTKALSVLDPLLSALAAAHQAGLIHRDVKPENVLLADDGRVKVADFGLARAVSAETQHTTAGVLIGTVSYLAPELLVAGRADARSDVYAAGVVLYEMLTGRKPHGGDSAIQVAFRHVHEDVPPPSRLVPGLPAYVDALVARATSRDPDLRPADARVLLHQVRRVRAALDHGVLDDPELTSDLTPTLPVQRLGRDPDDIDYVRDDPGTGPGAVPTILAPAQAVQAAERDTVGRHDTSVIHGLRAPLPPQPPTRAGPHPPAGRSAHPRRGPVLAVVLAVVLAAVIGLAGWWYGVGRFTTTPGVVNLSTRAAEAKVGATGLRLVVAGRAYSETVAPGSVVSTSPAGGESVPRHGTVAAVLSRGPERHRVPTVRNLTVPLAQAALRDARLAYGGASHAYSATAPSGVVLQSNPRPGTSLRRGAAVVLLVSKGPRPVRVADYTGRRVATATAALTRLHLQARVSRRNSDTVRSGDVISQTPRTGRLTPGQSVRLVVSKGPVLVDVPEVRRMTTTEATAALQQAGFSVRVERLPYYISIGLVVNQAPGAGSRAPRGSTITIYIV